MSRKDLVVDLGLNLAAGDMLYAISPSVHAKLPIGLDGEVLTVSLGLPSWEAALILVGDIDIVKNTPAIKFTDTGTPRTWNMGVNGTSGFFFISDLTAGVEAARIDTSRRLFLDFTTTKAGSAPADAAIGRLDARFKTSSATQFHVTGLFYGEQDTATTHSIQGVEGYALCSHGSGTVALAIGVPGNVQLTGAGTLTAGRGLQGGIVVSAGTLVSGMAVYAAPSTVAGGAPTNGCGPYVDT